MDAESPRRSITYTVTRRELWTLIGFAWRGPQLGSMLFSGSFFILTITLVVYVVLRGMGSADFPEVSLVKAFDATICALFVIQALFLWMFITQNEAAPGRMGRRTFMLGDEGFTLDDTAGSQSRNWAVVRLLASTRDHLIVYVFDGRGEAIPKAAFPSSAAADAFLVEARRLHIAAKQRSGVSRQGRRGRDQDQEDD